MSNEELTGRGLDIAIVERVMDWLPPGDPATKAMRSRLRLTHPSYNDHYLTPEGELRKPPYYSVDAAATMEVAERLRTKDYTVFIRGNSDGWFIQVEGKTVCTSESESLPEAVYRAALASLPEVKDCEDER